MTGWGPDAELGFRVCFFFFFWGGGGVHGVLEGLMACTAFGRKEGLEGCRVSLGLSLALEYMPNSTETLPHVPYALCYLDTCHVSARNLDRP